MQTEYWHMIEDLIIL